MNSIEEFCRELKSVVSIYEPTSFIGHINFMMQHHKQGSEIIRNETSSLHLRSPARQLIYIASLYLSTEKTGNERFDNSCFKEITTLANKIEDLYIESYLIELDSFEGDYIQKLRVSSSTYLSYFVNAELNYIEQDLARIEDTFKVFNDHIKISTGLYLSDFLDFFDATAKLEIDKVKEWQKFTSTEEWKKLVDNFRETDWDKLEQQNPKLYSIFWDYLDNPSIYLSFTLKDLSEYISKDIAKKCLNYFATEDQDKDFLFYTQKPCLLQKPIIKHKDNYYLFFQKQITFSIYWFLFNVCMELDSKKERIHKRREKRLEKKVQNLFIDFFGSNTHVFSNYIFNKEEKDLLILHKSLALIIEVKANKKNEPFRDSNKAFTRIKRDFKECIQKGYDQTYAIKKNFLSGVEFEILTEDGPFKVISRKYQNVFSIVVTQERYGQIQTDLGLLLDIFEDDYYPWSVSIDDLEVFLLTLLRKNSKIAHLISFLTHRELLHERLVCSDELELCGYFIKDKPSFLKNCQDTGVFISPHNASSLFDDLYSVGFGFENEKHMEIKNQLNALSQYYFQRTLGLKPIKKSKR